MTVPVMSGAEFPFLLRDVCARRRGARGWRFRELVARRSLGLVVRLAIRSCLFPNAHFFWIMTGTVIEATSETVVPLLLGSRVSQKLHMPINEKAVPAAKMHRLPFERSRHGRNRVREVRVHRHLHV